VFFFRRFENVEKPIRLRFTHVFAYYCLNLSKFLHFIGTNEVQTSLVFRPFFKLNAEPLKAIEFVTELAPIRDFRTDTSPVTNLTWNVTTSKTVTRSIRRYSVFETSVLYKHVFLSSRRITNSAWTPIVYLRLGTEFDGSTILTNTVSRWAQRLINFKRWRVALEIGSGRKLFRKTRFRDASDDRARIRNAFIVRNNCTRFLWC